MRPLAIKPGAVSPTVSSLFSRLERAGLTASDLARAANIDPSTLSRWRRGEVRPSHDLVEHAETVLGKMLRRPRKN